MNTERPPGTAPAAQRSVVVFDGACGFCDRQVRWIRSRDRSGAFEFAARQTPGLIARFPVLADGDFNTGMRLIRPDGSVCVGADAVYEIARRLPMWRRLAWLYHVPGLHTLARAAYAWIAANRQRLSGTGDDACRL